MPVQKPEMSPVLSPRAFPSAWLPGVSVHTQGRVITVYQLPGVCHWGRRVIQNCSVKVMTKTSDVSDN